ncbi:hypothetical protein [Streptomyces sp. NPDC002758]
MASAAHELGWLEWKSTLDFRPKNRADKRVLYRRYAGCLDGQEDAVNRRIEAALE